MGTIRNISDMIGWVLVCNSQPLEELAGQDKGQKAAE
jgi:hypothetical protein